MIILVFYIGVLLASLVIMALSGNYFVDALTSYAEKIGMSKYFIGMVVVAVATSSPDIATSVMGLLSGRPEIMSGVVLGGLMLDLAFLNGWMALLAKRIKINTGVIKGSELVILGIMLLPYVLMLDGDITRGEGFVMVMSFLIYVMLIWKREKSSGNLVKQIKMKFIAQDAAVFLLALGAMLIAARLAVYSVINLSSAWNIPVYLLSITVLAFAAALPDGIAGTSAILRGKGGEIGYGESIGTTLMEVNLFAGLVGIITPVHFGVYGMLAGLIGLMLSATFFMLILRRGVITRGQGVCFVLIYAAYLAFEITRITYWHF
jgi:cation:H+ antiporter